MTNSSYKTSTMLMLELRHGEDIAELLREGSVREVACKLGISISSVSIWRRHLRSLGVMV